MATKKGNCRTNSKKTLQVYRFLFGAKTGFFVIPSKNHIVIFYIFWFLQECM